MPACTYRGRRAASIENPQLRLTVLIEGGHIAEILDKRSGINPLWTPRWPSIEPSSFDTARYPQCGGAADGRLLAGIMGHNVCLDIFGGPSAEEAAAGLSAHGEGSIVPYAIEMNGAVLEAHAELPHAGLTFMRRMELRRNIVSVDETVTNMTACDRPIGWTQHVTLGAPFLKHGLTEFRASATRSKVFEGTFGPADYLAAGAIFDWPYAPRRDGDSVDLQRHTEAPVSSAYTAHLMDPSRADAFFVAFDPEAELAFGYEWRQADFPWMGIWEENHSGRLRRGTTARRTWHGVRRVAVSRDAARDDRARPHVRHVDIPMDSAQPDQDLVPDHRDARRARARVAFHNAKRLAL